jgi:uncharacterized protein (DUF1330 family)
MPAFIVFIREKTRVPEELKTYSEMAQGSTAGHPVKVRAFYGPQETLEGPPSEGVVILEFPSVAEAKAWYESPAYGAARQHRFLGADYRVILLEGTPELPPS